VAALFMVAAIVFLHSGRPQPQEPTPVSRLAAVSPKELANRSLLFREIERLFPDQLRWIAEFDRELSLGVHPAMGGPIGNARPLLVRVMVLFREDDHASWSKRLETDVLTYGEEHVELALHPGDENRLSLWAYPLPDGKVAVDVSLCLTDPVRASVERLHAG